MKAHLLGTRLLDFTAGDNSPVKGIQLFIAYEEDGVVGQRADKLFLRDGFSLPDGLKPGCMLDIAFNNRGKPESIRVVPQKQLNISTQ